MIKINKTNEPGELTKYRKSPSASYANMPKEVKEIIVQHLLKEQGGLCAYCMRRIPSKAKTESIPGCTIEHWKAQNGNPQNDLNYANMVAVCDGHRGYDKDLQTCDASRGNVPLTVNPLDEKTLVDIFYTANGEIDSKNQFVSNDLNNILNLNCSKWQLPKNRMVALDTMLKTIDDKFRGRSCSRLFWERMLHNFENRNSFKTEYVGILTWWLRKKLQMGN